MDKFAYVCDWQNAVPDSANPSAFNSLLSSLLHLFASWQKPRVSGNILDDGQGAYISSPIGREPHPMSAVERKKLGEAISYASSQGIFFLGTERRLPYPLIRQLAQQYGMFLTDGFAFRLLYGWEGIKKQLREKGLDLDEVEICIVGCFSYQGELLAHLIAPEIRFLTLVEEEKEQAAQLGRELLGKAGIAVKLATPDFPPHHAHLICLLIEKPALRNWFLPPEVICWDLTGGKNLSYLKEATAPGQCRILTEVTVEVPFQVRHPVLERNIYEVDVSLGELLFLAQSGRKVGKMVPHRMKIEELTAMYAEAVRLGYRFGSLTKAVEPAGNWQLQFQF